MKNPATKAREVDRFAVLRRALAYFLPLFSLVLVVVGVTYFADVRSTRIMIEEEEKHGVETEIKLIRFDLELIDSELLFLANSSELEGLFTGSPSSHSKAKADLEEEFLVLCEKRKLYDQVRLLDAKGLEIIRVNYNDGEPVIVPESELQDKSHRYYFKKSFELDKGQVYVSPFDLNIEQQKIEYPLKPILRFGTPVFDKKGVKRGIVVLNYLGNRLLDKVSETGHLELSRSMLVNADGYWLKGLDREDEWGFMFDDRKERTFGKAYPEAWQQIRSGVKGQFETPAGFFTFDTMKVLQKAHGARSDSSQSADFDKGELVSSSPEWKVVSFMPSGALYAERNRKLSGIALFAFVIGLILGLASWRVAWSGAVRRRALALQKGQDILVSVLNNAAYGVFLSAEDGKVTYVNREFTNITGYAPEDVPRTEDWHQKAHPGGGYRKDVLDDWNLALREMDINGSFDWVARVACKNGEVKDVEFRQSFLDENRTLLMLSDITERLRSEEEIENHRKHLEEMVLERTAELRKVVNLMSGREVRMAELKGVIEKLRAQLEEAGLTPVANGRLPVSDDLMMERQGCETTR